MAGSLPFLLAGIIGGSACMGIVWLVVSSVLRGSAARAEAGRNAVIASIGEMCAEVDNALAGYKLGSVGSTELKETVRPKLEKINAKLKANMKSMDPYFVKYVERFVEEQWQGLRGAAKGALTDLGPGVAVAVGQEQAQAAQPQLDLFDESQKRTTAVPAIGTEEAEAALEEAEAEEPAVEEAKRGEERPPEGFVSLEPQPLQGPAYDTPEAAVEQVLKAAHQPPVPQATEEQGQAEETVEEEEARAEEQEQPDVSPDFTVTQVMETAAPPIEEPQPEAAEEYVEEEQPFSNTYVPIEQSGLLDDDGVGGGYGQTPATEVAEEEAPSKPEATFEAKATLDDTAVVGTESDTLAISGEAIAEQSDIERTQAYNKDTLSQVVQELEKEDGGPGLGVGEEEQQPILTAEDASAGESFIFGGGETGTQEPAAGEQGVALEERAASPKEEEEVFEVGLPQEEQADDDSLITGEDVIKKMDDFFNFNK